MRGDRFGDSHLVVLCDGEDAVDVPARVDGDALARPGVPDEVDEVLHLRRGSEDLLFDWVLGVHRDVASGQQLSEVESVARLLGELHPVLERRVVRGALHRLLVVLERGGVVPLLERGLAVAEVALLPAGAETHGDVGVGRGHGVVLQFEVAEGEVAVDGAARGVVGCADHGIAVAALEGRRGGSVSFHFVGSRASAGRLGISVGGARRGFRCTHLSMAAIGSPFASKAAALAFASSNSLFCCSGSIARPGLRELWDATWKQLSGQSSTTRQDSPIVQDARAAHSTRINRRCSEEASARSPR